MIKFSLEKKLHTAHGALKLAVADTIDSESFVSLYGKSGTGKTSILRMLAGLMQPENGLIKMNEEVWFDHKNNINISTQKRKIGFVFQDYALFPNMNVRENVAFALAKNAAKNMTDELLELTGLSMMADRKVQQLSGGQQQRVALARAIAMKPNLLLLDEPLSAIDDDQRLQLQDTLMKLHKRFHLTTLLVSHDIREIVKLSDSILHLENGILKHYNSTAAFLNITGYIPKLSGIIVAVDENGISVFAHQSLLTIPVSQKDAGKHKIGAEIEIHYDSQSTPVIHILP